MEVRHEVAEKVQMASQGRTDISIVQKKELCQYKEENPGATQGDIATVFQRKWIPIARTVGDILKRNANWDTSNTYQLKTFASILIRINTTLIVMPLLNLNNPPTSLIRHKSRTPNCDEL